jgi:hypothetical protein
MEIFMPSLVAILLAVGVAFFAIPKIAPSVLMIASGLVLVLAIMSHLNRFKVTEYERAAWIYQVKDYMGLIIFAVIVVGAYGFLTINQGQPSSGPALPELTLPTVGGGMGTIMKTVESRIGQLMRKGRISID